MTLRQCQPNPARTRRHLFRLCHQRMTTNAPPEKACTPPLTAVRVVAGQGRGHLIYDLGIPRDIC